MDERLSSFLQYDYTEARTIATTLLTMSGGLLAGGLVFGEKFIELHRQPRQIWRWGMGGLYAFCAAGLAAGAALINNYSNMLGLLHDHQREVVDGVRFAAEVAKHNLSNALLFIMAGVLMFGGLFFLFVAADKGRGTQPLSSTSGPPRTEPVADAALSAEEGSLSCSDPGKA
ncbi:hypothetical protein GBZ26_05855 [Azospirillum formosense]|uniref:Uncharacterized protein n=1 Tax=Azospirillum formosense TaxID=861533 RepID=A0ABX2KTN5_9PROT|nr:hypothetical protein [Azospirillum formosense]MBY3757741.1 hypothetical protein [Azospirillum formosense]NUB18742.1 hypothetical protein [Azospirillum formosense]